MSYVLRWAGELYLAGCALEAVVVVGVLIAHLRKDRAERAEYKRELALHEQNNRTERLRALGLGS